MMMCDLTEKTLGAGRTCETRDRHIQTGQIGNLICLLNSSLAVSKMHRCSPRANQSRARLAISAQKKPVYASTQSLRFIYIYIYIYISVCVSVTLWRLFLERNGAHCR